jgi:hypothetical protein
LSPNPNPNLNEHEQHDVEASVDLPQGLGRLRRKLLESKCISQDRWSHTTAQGGTDTAASNEAAKEKDSTGKESKDKDINANTAPTKIFKDLRDQVRSLALRLTLALFIR